MSILTNQIFLLSLMTLVLGGPPLFLFWKLELWRVWTNDPLGERARERKRQRELEKATSKPSEHP